MGDAADYILESIDYAMYCDSDGYDYDSPPIRKESPKTCRCCGKKNLHWMVIAGQDSKGLLFTKWVLGDNRGMHKCKKKELKIKRI